MSIVSRKVIMKKKPKKDYWHKQFFFVTVDLFNADIGVCVNASEKEIKDWLKKVSGKNYDDFNEKELEGWDTSKTDQGRMIPFRGGEIIILKFEKNEFRKSLGVLFHEVSHAVYHLCNDRRTPLTDDTDEIYAYMNESVMVQILNKLY
jgi:hypothetical protein